VETTELKPFRRIATEEGFSAEPIVSAIREFLHTRGDEEPTLAAMLKVRDLPSGPRVLDPQTRIADMDASGIDTQLLLLISPGVQMFDADRACELAVVANDTAASWVKGWPGRFEGLAVFAPQAPERAAEELHRAVSRLGLKGGIVNSNTKGEYLDHAKYWPIFEAAESLGVPIYIHPREVQVPIAPLYQEYGLEGAAWGYAAETSLHALRLIMSGLFDRFPKLTIVLGHLGEGIPFYLDRIDNRYLASSAPRRFGLKRLPSEYFRDNFVVTTSGANWWPSVRLCRDVLGPERVLFAVDYPFENEVETVKTSDQFPLTDDEFVQLYSGNAERVFGINS
jgi:5-carboxyvanillate decarboxylase